MARERAKAIAWLAASLVAGALGVLFAAAGQLVGLPLALVGLVGTIVAIRRLQPRPRAPRASVAPIEAPPREALDAMEWPHAACPRCGFMDLLWGGPARLVTRCVRCGYQGEPGVYGDPAEFERHLAELRDA